MNVEKIIKTKKEMSIETRTIIHLSLVNSKLNEAMTNALKPFDVSLQQFNVLRILRGQNGLPANLSTLNERMVTKMSNTTRLVDKLLLKGFANRKICPTNRRKIEISITQKGHESLKEMDKAMELAEAEVLVGFTHQDLEELNTLLDKF
ncbi:MarR family winged helix-turn-helix transcriptional regulator [uncultured Croceitalea sp.]|uniref:MarR family winged helix-turn-helix transcriptional regulator n=1 Tax=uncultured Croceitalea sp. TaxID=1798908 RepID=UPI00374E6497